MGVGFTWVFEGSGDRLRGWSWLLRLRGVLGLEVLHSFSSVVSALPGSIVPLPPSSVFPSSFSFLSANFRPPLSSTLQLADLRVRCTSLPVPAARVWGYLFIGADIV